MNVKRFSARTAREALGLVRQALGADAVVLSTRPSPEGVEVLAMAPDGVAQIERVAATAAAPAPGAVPNAATIAPASSAPSATHAATPTAAAPAAPRSAEAASTSVEQDVARLSMSTLSFQDYVRERMLRRRRAAEKAPAASAPAASPVLAEPAAPARSPAAAATEQDAPPPAPRSAAAAMAPPPHAAPDTTPTALWLEPEPIVARRAPQAPSLAAVDDAHRLPRLDAAAPSAPNAMLDELRAVRGLIEDRFGALAFMEKLQRQPRQAQLTQRLLDHGFSPALIRKLVDALPAEGDPMAWAAGVLERNLATGEGAHPIEDAGGIYALVGATGVGKTTSTAKLAAAFATRHGASQLGLITLDAYRVAAHEQLRAYGRILGVPVHTAHDRASLEDLLDLLSAKKMVLIDTAGMAQRDARTRELLDMLSHRDLNRLLVVNAAAQGETIDDVLHAYRAASCRGVILSKVDEAVKLGPAVDAMIRHKLAVVGVANGQRVPEDWHRLSARALVQQALRPTLGGAWRLDAGDVSLVFAGVRERAAAEVHA